MLFIGYGEFKRGTIVVLVAAMIKNLFLPIALLLTACSDSPKTVGQTAESQAEEAASADKLSEVETHYREKSTHAGTSVSSGTPGSGALENGYILPFSGKNFHYFDTNSYLHDRCFVNGKVKETLLVTYKRLETEAPGRLFGIMECSNEHGGKIAPHRTHQNGLSVDFMSPLQREGKPYTDLDFQGAPHYLMDFDANGVYENDAAVSIDFELMAQHLLLLIEEAKKQGLTIEKIIWKTALQDELFATPSGKKLQATGVYVTPKLQPLINRLHDDHYHVDFKVN